MHEYNMLILSLSLSCINYKFDKWALKMFTIRFNNAFTNKFILYWKALQEIATKIMNI